jgi:hypothetical protein
MFNRDQGLRYPISTGVVLTGLAAILIGALTDLVLNQGEVAGLFTAWGIIVMALAMLVIMFIFLLGWLE